MQPAGLPDRNFRNSEKECDRCYRKFSWAAGCFVKACSATREETGIVGRILRPAASGVPLVPHPRGRSVQNGWAASFRGAARNRGRQSGPLHLRVRVRTKGGAGAAPDKSTPCANDRMAIRKSPGNLCGFPGLWGSACSLKTKQKGHLVLCLAPWAYAKRIDHRMGTCRAPNGAGVRRDLRCVPPEGGSTYCGRPMVAHPINP